MSSQNGYRRYICGKEGFVRHIRETGGEYRQASSAQDLFLPVSKNTAFFDSTRGREVSEYLLQLNTAGLTTLTSVIPSLCISQTSK